MSKRISTIASIWHARDGRSAPAPARWTQFYWPAALTLSLLAFFIPYFSHLYSDGIGLEVGMVAILIPEIIVVCFGQFQNTFSDWVWNTVHIARNEPISEWNAEHFLTCSAYIVIAASVCQSVFHDGTTQFTAAIMTSIWLLFHFFLQWWA